MIPNAIAFSVYKTLPKANQPFLSKLRLQKPKSIETKTYGNK